MIIKIKRWTIYTTSNSLDSMEGSFSTIDACFDCCIIVNEARIISSTVNLCVKKYYTITIKSVPFLPRHQLNYTNKVIQKKKEKGDKVLKHLTLS